MMNAALLLCFCISALLFSLVHCDGYEKLKPNCDCRDWYGGCRMKGEMWYDDDTWSYECSGTNGTDAKFLGCMTTWRVNRTFISVGQNKTINDFWYSCDANAFRLKYQQEPACDDECDMYHVGQEFREGVFQYICLETGRWITGCFYQNETKDWVFLKIGQTGYNGLVKHVCDKYDDYPGRVQYYAEVRNDIPYKSPPNKGINQNLPYPADNRLKFPPKRWLHETAAHFTESPDKYNIKIRYLPPSIRPWSTEAPHGHHS